MANKLNKLITDEEFIEACNCAKTMREACLILKLPFSTFKRRAEKLDCYLPNQGGANVSKPKFTKEEYINGLGDKDPWRRKLMLYKLGLKQDKCELCGWSEKPLGYKYSTCEIHHIDGNPKNNRLDNIQILCPNCHSLTGNFRFRGKKHNTDILSDPDSVIEKE